MGDKIEMSLEDIIKTSKIGKGRRGGGRGGGGAQRSRGGGFRSGANNKSPAGRQGGGNGVSKGGRFRGGSGGGQPQRPRFSRGDVNSAWKHDMFEGAKRGLRTGNGVLPGLGGISAKLLVSNLDYGVSESDIHELFADFGPLKNASVHYDRSGRSLGTAEVIFERRSDAVKAMKQYNGVPLDGRPMNIQLATSDIPSPQTVNRTRNFGGGSNGGGGNRQIRQKRPPPSGSRSGGSGGGGGGGRRPPRQPTVTPTSAELDAELDAYVNDMKL